MNSRIEQLKEYAKILKNTSYALKTYLKTYDQTQKKYVPFDLFPEQKQLVQDYENFPENITKKYRQAGVSTVTAAWISKIMQTAPEEQPHKILIAANKRDTSIEMANKIKEFLYQWPEWMNVGFDPDKNSETRFKLLNGCEVKAVASSKDALRGFTPTILVLDEAAYIEGGEDFWAASMASLSTGGKVIVISTPNGYDQIYWSIYDQALRGDNDFKITDMYWFNDPRYSKNMVWVKVDDLIHYMLNRAEYKDEDVTKYDAKQEEYFDLIEQGYKPFSPWFEKMSKKLKFDKRKIAQELECDFLGSGDFVISEKIRQNIVKNTIRRPIEKYMSNQMWQWEEPIQGHKYIMGVDVGRGDSADFSGISIIDFDERRQVLEYVGKMPPDDLGTVAYKWGTLYEAFIIIDITGGMGVATSRKLQELGYRDMFIDGINVKDVWDYNHKKMEKIPGINFNNKRVQIVSTFEEQLRTGFKVRSERIVNELATFVYLNGRPDHMKGKHDDAIMSIAMALYAGDISFSQLKRNTDKNKAELNSWMLSERTYDAEEVFYSIGSAMDSIGSMKTDNEYLYHQNNPMDATKDMYRKYSWLFGKPR